MSMCVAAMPSKISSVTFVSFLFILFHLSLWICLRRRFVFSRLPIKIISLPYDAHHHSLDCVFEGLNNSHWLTATKRPTIIIKIIIIFRWHTRFGCAAHESLSQPTICLPDRPAVVVSSMHRFVLHVHNIYSLARYEIINCFVPPRRATEWRDDGYMILGFDFISVRSSFLFHFSFFALAHWIGWPFLYLFYIPWCAFVTLISNFNIEMNRKRMCSRCNINMHHISP